MATPRIVVEDSTGELLATTDPVTFGGRTGCAIVVDDPIAADRHCEFAHDGAFRVRDLGSVTGTWLDGQRVAGPCELRDGCQVVFGASRVLVRLEERDGAPTLVLQLQRNGFWWRKPGKKVFDNDPDALVRSEVAFGRFPALRAGNRLALVAAAVLAIGGTFVASILEPLADAGPLLPFHARVTGDEPVDAVHADFARCRALADAQGCNVCHETGNGTPHTKCLQCHQDLAADGGRHPYVGDGELGALPRVPVAGFCEICHTDHQGADWLKPAAAERIGKCDACHDDQRPEDLARRAPPRLPPARQVAFATWRFPHDVHVGKQIDCAVCHRIDPEVQANRAAGFPDDPDRHDFAEVPYETCAACHVPGAPPAGLTAQQQETFRAKDHQWTVAWHGTDQDGAGCLACHTQGQRGGRTVFGPELRTVARPVATADQYAAERARYTSGQRRHADEFARHADGKACTVCHVNGGIAALPDATRPFWHALHLADGALLPNPGAGGAISTNATEGCISCHADLQGSKGLRNAAEAAYHWPATEQAQKACSECHAEAGRPLPLQATSTTIPPARQGSGIDFPHDVHVRAASFGTSGALAEGCFACHDFEPPSNGNTLQLVPRTRPGAADCSSCHTGHANVGGGQCQQCHPIDRASSNSFLLAAAVEPGTVVGGRPVAAPPQRSWPGRGGFSHLSRGHAGPDLTCATCHDPAAVGRAKSLADVPVPDEATPACRECHLRQQFHWR